MRINCNKRLLTYIESRMEYSRMNEHVREISPDFLTLVRIKYQVGTVKHWSVETNTTNVAIVDKDSNLNQTDAKHEKWRREARILVLK